MKIFDVEAGKLILNENCLLIPELKAIVDLYQEDPVPALTYIYFMTSPESPYHNLSQDEKEEILLADIDGDFDHEDELVDVAIAKCKKLYETPVQYYYEGQKNAMHVVGKYLTNLTESSISSGRDGNLSEIRNMQKEAGKTMESFLKLEKLWKEQVQQKLRGMAELGEY
jgi:hypothetical protein